MYATADALVEPDWRDRGLLDTAVVASSSTTAPSGSPRPASRRPTATTCAARCSARAAWPPWATGAAPAWCSPARPAVRPTPPAATRSCCAGAYVAELAAFVDAVRSGGPAPVGGRGRPGRAGDRAGRGRVGARRAPGADRRGGRVTGPVDTGSSYRLAVSRRDGVRRPALRRPGPADRRPRVRGRDLGLDARRTSTPWPQTGATFSSMTGYVTGTLADPDGAEELLRTAEQSLRGRRAARLPAAERARHRAGRRSGLPVHPDARSSRPRCGCRGAGP